MDPESRRDRFLERALVANFVIHGLAMLAMVALLLPYLPGGSTIEDGARVRLLARAPLRFRLGWLPWQLCAACDLWMAIAMVRVSWLPKVATGFVLLATIAAVVPDQFAQASWITVGVSRARQVVDEPSLQAYLRWERSTFDLTAGWGATFYTLGGLGWTASFALASVWRRSLTWLSIPLWLAMGYAVTGPLLPGALRPLPSHIAMANALGFALLQVWLGLVTELVLRRRRPIATEGRLAPWRHPWRNIVGRSLDVVAQSRLASALLEPLPVMAMVSDITDVVYVSYLVPAERVAAMVPHGLELDRLGPNGEHALVTFLTFRHGHFGFRFLGPLRRLSPSAIQTNWRIHVRDPRTDRRGIFFVTNAITQSVQALGARLFSEGMPMHVLESAAIEVDPTSGRARIDLVPGEGSAPDAHIDLTPTKKPTFQGPWAEGFGDFESFLAYCVPQNRAMSSQPWHHRLTRQEIELPIALDQCIAMEGVVESRAAQALVGDAKPICFYVTGLAFLFSCEIHESL